MRHWTRGSSLRHRKHKYDAIATIVDGQRFASRKEARVYAELKAQETVGQIAEIIRQPRFELQPKPYRIVYVADFQVRYHDGRTEILEVKGYETDVWKLKQKLFLAKYPHLTLRVVT